jgi:hypothetical protein
MTSGRVGCDELEAVAPELALGTLSGPERADAVGHLAACRDCQRRVAELTEVVDSLLLLAPEDDPSDELEACVLARTVGQTPSHRSARISRHRQLLVACGAVAAVVVAGLGLFMLLREDDPARAVRTAVAVGDGGRSVCRAVINEVDPAWLFVSLDEADDDSSVYTVELELEGGRSMHVGEVDVREGHGVLAVTIDLGDKHARAVRLLDEHGERGYEARFL